MTYVNFTYLNNAQVNGEDTYVDGLLITVEKTINLRLSQAATSIITIEKDIKSSLAASSIITIGKDIRAELDNSFYNRNGWEVFITVGTVLLRANQLHGGVQIVKNENDNHTAQFTVILSPAVYDLYTYQGKDVTITVRTKPNGVLQRLFTGKVDVPVVNTIEEKLTLNCVADRRVLLNNIEYFEPYIGFYSESVLGTNSEVYERITARMSTIPSSLDFDSNNNFAITSWTPKATADFTYGSSAVYRRDPQLSVDSSGQIVNKINIQLEYGYLRHHQRFGVYIWQHPYAPTNINTGEGGICPFLIDAPSIPTRDMILQAAESAGWPIVPQTMFFGKQFRSGSYQCSGVWVQWSTQQISYVNEPQLDANGNPVRDQEGNQIYTVRTTGITDWTDVYTMYAQWVASTQFNQNVREQYNITVQSPESIARYGTIANQESYGYTANDIWTQWEDYPSYRSPPTGVVKQTDPLTGSYFFNGDEDRILFNQAYTCAINKAKTSILATHRTSRITFQRPLTPTMELRHTVETTGKWVRGKGKCERIIHNLGISDSGIAVGGEAFTEVTFNCFRGDTTVTETPLTVTSAPSDTTVPTEFGAILGTHLGQDPSQAGAEFWTGYVGNKQIVVQENGYTNYTRTYFQESFTVDTPAVSPALRDDRVLVKNVSYNINIPNDTTEYEAYG